ncbi:MAG: transposase [Chloroflexi bacterium]|nr:transposase [Chloroflexota bacterium]
MALGCQPLALGGAADHVHLPVSFTPTTTIARLVGEIDGASPHLITREIQPGQLLRWQGSHGACTVSRTALAQVRASILHQKRHHDYDATLPELEPFSPGRVGSPGPGGRALRQCVVGGRSPVGDTPPARRVACAAPRAAGDRPWLTPAAPRRRPDHCACASASARATSTRLSSAKPTTKNTISDTMATR